MVICTVFITYFNAKDAYQWLFNLSVLFVSIDTITFAKATKENDEYDSVSDHNVLQPGADGPRRRQPLHEQKSPTPPSTQEGNNRTKEVDGAR